VELIIVSPEDKSSTSRDEYLLSELQQTYLELEARQCRSAIDSVEWNSSRDRGLQSTTKPASTSSTPKDENSHSSLKIARDNYQFGRKTASDPDRWIHAE